MFMKEEQVRTSARAQMVDITGMVKEAIRESGVSEGVCIVYVPHTTAGVTINENADPDVKRDIITELEKIVPWDDGYRHDEGNSAAHLKATMTGFSQTVLITGGRPVLGTWQGIYFCEFDGPRNRKVYISVSES